MARATLLLTLVLLTLTFSATAQEAPADREERLRQFIDRFDSDGDGRLSPDERARARTLLSEWRQGREQAAQPQTFVPGQTDLYKITDGPHAIGVVETLLLHDAERDKDLPLRITFPEAGGPYPLVVYCHGALGSKDGGQPLVTHWARHGYVVVQPTFGDSISLMTDEQKRAVTSAADLVNSEQVGREWDQRPQDVKYVLDHLDEIEQRVDGLAGRILRERIIVGGHSYGAHTTMLLSGATLQHPRSQREVNLRDPRITAAFMISPSGPGGLITTESYKTLEGPILMITGDNDGTPRRGHENDTGLWRRQAFDGAPSGDKYLLWITGAHHGFGGISGRGANWAGSGPVAPDQVILVTSTILAFMDAYAKEDLDATAYLRSDRLEHAAGNAATLERK